MGKRQALTTYIAVAAIVIVVAAILGEQLRQSHGKTLVALVVLGLMAWTWGTFTPNSRALRQGDRARPHHHPVVSITFDDGPTAEFTPGVLDALRDADVKATFFCLGRNLHAHPELAQRIVNEGHELASHGYDHSIMLFARPKEIARQLRSTEVEVEAAVGRHAVKLFRTPHGFRSPFVVRVARELGYRVVGWTGSVFDTAKPGTRRDRRPLHQATSRPARSCCCTTATAAAPATTAPRRWRRCRGSSPPPASRGLEFVTVTQLAHELRPQHRRRMLLKRRRWQPCWWRSWCGVAASSAWRGGGRLHRGEVRASSPSRCWRTWGRSAPRRSPGRRRWLAVEDKVEGEERVNARAESETWCRRSSSAFS